MIIAGLQKTTLIDYPGKIAAIVFTRGCDFRCAYCHNPELVNPEIFYPEIKEEVIIDFLEKRRHVLEGVVITGGEPLIHSDIAAFIKKLKAMDYAVKLDTNGTNPKLLKELIDKKLIDYIAMDIKHSLDKYHYITPSSPPIEAINKSIKIIMNSGLPYEFRTTVLPRHFKKEDFQNIGTLIRGARIYYLQQFRPIKTLNSEYQEESSFSELELGFFKKIMEDYVDKCEIRGII